MAGVVEHQVVVMGAGGVGKSALTVQFVHQHFVETYDPTIEDAYRRQLVVDDIPVGLCVLDTAGQEEFSAMRGQYMTTGRGFLLCYSIVNKDSFDEVKRLHEQVLQAKDMDEGVPIVVVATKCDLEAQRKISVIQGQTLAKEWGVSFIETSARNRVNVEETFYAIVREIRKAEARELEEKEVGGGRKENKKQKKEKTKEKEKEREKEKDKEREKEKELEKAQEKESVGISSTGTGSSVNVSSTITSVSSSNTSGPSNRRASRAPASFVKTKQMFNRQVAKCVIS